MNFDRVADGTFETAENLTLSLMWIAYLPEHMLVSRRKQSVEQQTKGFFFESGTFYYSPRLVSS